MHTKTVIVGSAIGLHARPAAIISEAVVKAGVPVTLSVDGGEPVDAGSALMIMTLGAEKGTKVVVTCGASRFTLLTMPVEEYPALPTMPPVSGVIS